MIQVHSLELNRTNFYYDETPGFRMGIEKNWHMLDPVDVNNNLKLFDANLNRINNDNRYAIRIFYKLVLPLSAFADSGITENDLKNNDGEFTFENCTPIGVEALKCFDNTSQPQAVKCRGIILSDNTIKNNSNYGLPSDRQLNHTYIKKSDFSTGCSIMTLREQENGTSYRQINNANGFYGSYPSQTLMQNTTYMFCGTKDTDLGGVSAFSINDGYVSYSVSTEGNRLNLPIGTDDDDLYLMPLLFTPFGMSWSHGGTTAWLYCVLGVQEIDSDPETYRVRLFDNVYQQVISYDDIQEGTNITSWITSNIPTISGYTFTGNYLYSNPDFDQTNVNASCDITYVFEQDSPVTPSAKTFLNGDGDIAISQIPFSGTVQSGDSATVTVDFSGSIDTVTHTDIFAMEFGTQTGSMTITNKTDTSITFTDTDFSSHDFYVIQLFNNGSRVSQDLWNAGVKPIKITITVNGTTEQYDVNTL